VASATAPRRTQGERRAATRGALVSAARELFAERGFAGVSREEIVERAGVTRGAMYHYFASKEALFQAAYEEVERDLCEALAAAASAGSDPVEELRLGAVAFLHAAGTGEVRRIALLDAPAVLDADTRRALEEQYGLGLMRAVLSEIEAAGRLAVGSQEAMAPILMAAMHEAATQVAEGADEAAYVAIIEELVARITTPPTPGRPGRKT
jgi:AcrR family transcriptional regulator